MVVLPILVVQFYRTLYREPKGILGKYVLYINHVNANICYINNDTRNVFTITTVNISLFTVVAMVLLLHTCSKSK